MKKKLSIKTKKTICIHIGGIAFMMMFGSLGAIDRNNISEKAGIILTIVWAVICFCAWYKAGAFKWR